MAVWGAGREGRAAVELLRPLPLAELVLVDDDPAATGPPGVPLATGAAAAGALARAEIVVKSPGISRYRPEVASLVERGVVVTGGMAIWLAETADACVVGVTGTKGKSTTAALIHHLLVRGGVSTTLAGNIGVAVHALLADRAGSARPEAAADGPEPAGGGAAGPDVYVVEVSSYQAAEVTSSPRLGVLTSLYPEHLDWHGDVDRYVADKLNLFAHGHPDTHRLVAGPHVDLAGGRLDDLPVTRLGDGGVRVTDRGVTLPGGTVVTPSALALAGTHNLENVAVAVRAARALGVAAADAEVVDALTGFAPLAHRLTPLGVTSRGVLVVDDALATVPQASAAAVATFPDRAVTLIVGGQDRGVAPDPLVEAILARHAPTNLACVPDSGPRFGAAVADAAAGVASPSPVATPPVVRVRAFDDLAAATSWALAETPPGGVILLSPSGPSYHRFGGYEQLGAAFAALVAPHLRPGRGAADR